MKVARAFLLGALAISASIASVAATQCTDGCNSAYDACDAKMTESCKKPGALSPDYSCMAKNSGACFWARSDCIKACDPWVPLPDEPAGVSAPGPVTPPACQMACHKGEYAKVQACRQDADCVAEVKADIASCVATCPDTPSTSVSAPVSCRSQWESCNAGCWLQSCHNDCYSKFILKCTNLAAEVPAPMVASKKTVQGTACETGCLSENAKCVKSGGGAVDCFKAQSKCFAICHMKVGALKKLRAATRSSPSSVVGECSGLALQLCQRECAVDEEMCLHDCADGRCESICHSNRAICADRRCPETCNSGLSVKAKAAAMAPVQLPPLCHLMCDQSYTTCVKIRGAAPSLCEYEKAGCMRNCPKRDW